VSAAPPASFEVARTALDFRKACDAVRAGGKTLGLVPTMGALHEGHLALVTEARRHADQVAVTIFVNPTQFGPNEDLARYPRPLENDLALCQEAGATLVFTPEVEEMYPPGERTRVHVASLGDGLCGPFRPGHFDGVATIVTKLFAVTGPSVAVFGRKDYQQLAIVRRMVKDLLLPITLVGHPTVRDPDGLALSSRNAYLSPEERRRALSIPAALALVMRAHANGERQVGSLRRRALSLIEPRASRIDYFTIADADTLSAFPDDAQVGERALVAVAAHVGTTRLIDNVVLGEDSVPPAEVS
jgi:pantoate--beta-alanine ligase